MHICESCNREVSATTEHHLIPRATHKNKQVKKLYSRDQMNETVDLCRSCHSTIHSLISEKELALVYNSLEKLLENDGFYKFVKWVKKRKHIGNIKIRGRSR